MSPERDRIPGLEALRDVEPPPSLVPGVMRRITEPRPVSFWEWLRRPRRIELRVSPLGLGGAGLVAVAALVAFGGGRAPQSAAPLAEAPAAALPAAPEPAPEPTVLVRFSYNKPGARRVAVAGDFNGWDPDRTPLQESGAGSFAGTVRLPPGAHQYMFVVDGEWITDPAASERRPDGFGRDNAVLRL